MKQYHKGFEHQEFTEWIWDVKIRRCRPRLNEIGEVLHSLQYTSLEPVADAWASEWQKEFHAMPKWKLTCSTFENEVVTLYHGAVIRSVAVWSEPRSKPQKVQRNGYGEMMGGITQAIQVLCLSLQRWTQWTGIKCCSVICCPFRCVAPHLNLPT